MPDRADGQIEFEPLSGDELERIEATSSDSFVTEIARTALHHRQEAMDLRDGLRAAAQALEQAGFCVSADRAWEVLSGR